MPPLQAPPNTRFDFFSALAESELLSPIQFAKADGIVAESVAEARSAAKLLVNAKLLTSFQAERLLAGRAEGFVLGQHVIQEQVGKGSVGRVYRAVHRAMNRTVAIKVLDADLTRSDAARTAFQREIRAAAKLNHPNIITAYDANEVGGRSYLVLEFVDGPTLEAVVRERGLLPWPEACEYTRQVAMGLAHAHEQGLVHRDIKPANLLVARTSATLPGCVVKIADFGLAKFTPSPAAAKPAPGLTGTADFVSPEQAYNPRLADHRADLYSLGCVLYFLLVGRAPFHGGDTAAKIRRHQLESPAPIQSLRPDLPPTVVELVHRLLAKDPNHRPQSAEDVAALLSRPTAEAMINFDLPPVQPGPYSFATNRLSGIVAGETSPWSQLTDEVLDAAATSDSDETPFFDRPRRRGLPGFVVLGVCLAVVAASALGLVLLLKLVGK
jgi:serine/threonine-protein kinase